MKQSIKKKKRKKNIQKKELYVKRANLQSDVEVKKQTYDRFFMLFQIISEFWIFTQALLVINNWYMHKIIELFQSTNKKLMLFNYRYIFYPVSYW